jgi:polar amino acid transport system substrate-binding protein
LYAKKFDLVMSSLSYTAEREKKVGYSIPYVEASQAMVIRAGDQAHITSMIQSIDAGQTEAAK